ncbi:MAG: T9SS type A sorting domain-containing protein, partial [Bacteroidetes bacterium]|nr:T9SS type A sorting domain-containing protein [Bacteroidota bacterium]
WNPLGQVIRRISFPELNAARRFELMVSDLSRGTYILKVNQAGKVYTFRLVLI